MEQELLRKRLQQEQELLQGLQESQEAKLFAQHEREKQHLDEKVEASKLELQKQVYVEKQRTDCTFLFSYHLPYVRNRDVGYNIVYTGKRGWCKRYCVCSTIFSVSGQFAVHF